MTKQQLDKLACPCCGEQVDKELIKKLEELEEKVGKLAFSSGRRCAKYTASKGWSLTSPHVKGLAVDITEHSARRKFKILFEAAKLGFLGHGVYNGHVHVDIDPRWHGEPVIWPGVSK